MDLTLVLGDYEFPLQGKTLQQGLRWLGEQLGTPLELLPHELPRRDIEKPFACHGAEQQILEWFQMGAALLASAVEKSDGGEVRLWPHHFDIAALVELEPEAEPETARSINVGLSPGDASYAEPYWYVTPWPKPTAALPTLGRGAWHEQGFTAAVLQASRHRASGPKEDAAAFLDEAIAACRTLLE